jgi:hypothetical protein
VQPKTVTVLFIGAVVVVALAMSFDIPGGPTQELEGVVKGTAVEPRDTGPSPQIATIALSTGVQVQAAVNSRAFVHPGQAVRVLEHRGIMSGRKTYEVLGAKEAK